MASGGQSTTMRMIAGLDRPTTGTVRVNGKHYPGAAAPMSELGILLDARSVHPTRRRVRRRTDLRPASAARLAGDRPARSRPCGGTVISVLLVDDHSLIRMGFRLVLDAETDIEVVGEAADGAAAVSMCSALRPDVVLMDVRMPGHDGIEATRDIVAAGLPCKVLILTTFDLYDYVYAGLRAGASGFLLKDTPPDAPGAGIPRTV
jgi:CheY-like chemotaxis protein